jgi:hypothetical protein
MPHDQQPQLVKLVANNGPLTSYLKRVQVPRVEDYNLFINKELDQKKEGEVKQTAAQAHHTGAANT